MGNILLGVQLRVYLFIKSSIPSENIELVTMLTQLLKTFNNKASHFNNKLQINYIFQADIQIFY